jgi:hypothetical protein
MARPRRCGTYRGGKQYGPVSDQDLLRLAEQGKLSADDLVWKPGFDTWKTVHSVPGLLKPPATKAETPPPLPASASLQAFAAVRFLPVEFAAGGAVVGVMVPLADLVFEWRGRKFVSWETPGGVGENIGYFLGGPLVVAIIGLIVGFAVKWSLRKRLLTPHRAH